MVPIIKILVPDPQTTTVHASGATCGTARRILLVLVDHSVSGRAFDIRFTLIHSTYFSIYY